MYKYSTRLSWSFSPNRISELAASKRHAGEQLLDLTVSNPTEVDLDYPHAGIGRALANVGDYTYQPDPFGESQARRAIADYYRRRGIKLTPEHILLTASTSESYSILFKLFCDPGDEILIPTPSYPLFEYLAALDAVRVVPYRLSYDGSWSIDFSDLRQRISSRSRAIVIVAPNNPTGSYLKSPEREALFSLALVHQLPIISDEVFADYPLVDAAHSLSLADSDSVLSFSLNGLSKIAGMPQLKLGWLIVNGPPSDREQVERRLELLLDTYLSVNTPVQRALPELLTIGAGVQQQIQKRVISNWQLANGMLRDTPAHCLYNEGGWSTIIRLPATLAEETWVTRLLNEYGVVVQPGYFFDMASEPYVVVSLISPPDVLSEGLERLRALLRQSA